MRYPVARSLLAIALLAVSGHAAAQKDVAGSQDHPLFTRMPGYAIESYSPKDFDAFEFPRGGGENVRVEGKTTAIQYTIKSGAKAASMLQIVRNHEAALKKIGGTTVFGDNCCNLTLKLVREKGEVWAHVKAFNGGDGYSLTIVEKGEMEQQITANSLFETIQKEGHVALYVNFDTDKATLKPDAQPVLDQVAAMLKANPSLKLRIEGHTDASGSRPKNQTLSDQRAKAVLDALVKAGTAASRLTSAGFGQERPVADNGTSEGRAKNRRVELVRQ